MARIDIKSAGATLSDGVLQLQNGVAMDSTLRNVADQSNTTSPLKLSTTAVQVVSPLRITTDDPSDMYLDCEDGATNNRFNITRNTASQQVNLNFASNPIGSTTVVGAIRTYQDGTNLLPTLQFVESGDIYQNKYSGVINNIFTQDNAGVNMTNGTGVYQGDYVGRRNGSTSTLFREALTYNGDGTTRRGRYSMGVAESSSFGAYQLVLTQYQNLKVNISGSNAGSYIDDALSPTTAYNIHAGNIINTTGSVLPLLSLDVNGLTKHVFQTNGNVSFNNTSDMAAVVGIKGSGSTSATTSLLVQNSAGTAALTVRDDLITIFGGNLNVISGGTIGISNNSRSITFDSTGATNLYTAFGGHRFSIFNQSSYIDFATITGNTTTPSLLIGVGTVNNSAIVNITSTTQGFLPPRMTNAQRAAITTPAIGLMVYCTDAVEGIYVYKSTGWTFVA